MQRTFDRTTIASPPDDGGHEGTFSWPEDELMVRNDDVGPVPPMHYDGGHSNTIDRDEHPHRGLGWISGTILLAALSAAAVALVTLLAG